MIFSRKEEEKERFKRVFADELLEYHFERVIGKNKDNEKQWRVLLDDNIQPHAEILCDFSNWLLARGWANETVEEFFFVAIDAKKSEEFTTDKKSGWFRSFLRWFRP